MKWVYYTLEQNWEILKTYFQSDESTQTVRNLRGKFGRKEMPSSSCGSICEANSANWILIG